MSYNYSAILNIMLKTARKASRMLVRDYGEICHLQSSLRNIDNFVATSKSKVTANLIKDLQAARTDYSIIVDDEKYQTTESSYTWIINPIDGLVNFSHGLPNFAVSIGLIKKNKNNELENVAIVIDAPIINETYFSEKGSGSWLEKHVESSGSNFRLRVSARSDLKGSLIAKIGNCTFDDDSAHFRFDGTKDLALAYLAAGRYDVVIAQSSKMANSPATLLIYEAGGVVKELNASQLIATNNNMMKLF